jgi:hypothetical protein
MSYSRRAATVILLRRCQYFYNCSESPFARFRLGLDIRGDDVARQQLRRSAYMTKRSMDPFSADYYLPGNTGVPVQSRAEHCIALHVHKGT